MSILSPLRNKLEKWRWLFGQSPTYVILGMMRTVEQLARTEVVQKTHVRMLIRADDPRTLAANRHAIRSLFFDGAI